MEIIEIIKDSFVYPSHDIGKLAIYIVFSIVIAGLLVGGVASVVFSNFSGLYTVISIFLFICAVILGFIISGYQISVVKSSISVDDDLPEYQWRENLITGIKNFIVTIVYYIIPAIITAIVALITNVPGNFYAVIQDSLQSSVNTTLSANVTAPAVSGVSNILVSNLFSSLAITAVIGIIIGLIFAFIHTMGTARLANTGSLTDAINIIEAFRDIGRVGYIKVIAVVLLVAIITIIINMILQFIVGYIPQLAILSVIITPYLVFFSYRSIGLLYSDIS